MSEWKKVFENNISLYCRIIIQYLIKSGWEYISIDNYTKKMPDFPVKEAVQSKLYKKEGLFPIVSQSKDLISGFSDDEQLLNKISKPITIFGDHTQVVKYIDFDFVLGADGTKILTVTNDYNPKFFYYLIKSIDLHSNKYARHYSKLRKEIIPFQKNSLSIQSKIVSFLDSLENNNISNESYFDKETEQKILSLQKNSLNVQLIKEEIESQKNYIKQLRQNILQNAIEGKLTADWRKQNPVQKGNPDYDAEALFEQIQKERNNEKKQKELSPITDEEKPFEIPEGWKWVHFGDVIEIATNIVESSDYKDIIQVGPEDIEKNTGRLIYPLKTVREKGIISVNHIFHKNMIVYSKIRPRLRKIAYVDFDGVCSADMYPLKTTLNYFYIKNLMLSDYFDLEVYKFDNRVKMPKINQPQLNSIKIPIPPVTEQKEIVVKVETYLQSLSTLENQITESEQQTKQLMQNILKYDFE